MARVISRILERADRDNETNPGERVNYKLGVPMLLTGSGRSVRPMYIEGLGPLFMIKVNFALLPAAKVDEKLKKTKTADTEWDEAHRDVFGAEQIADEYSPRTSSYKEGQVELLKKELIGALKNAANIRGLKPDEFVNIAVFGHAARVKSSGYSSKGAGGYAVDTIPVDAGVDKGSVLTLRARKADIDAAASGKLDADAFKAKVNLTAYAGSGTGITSINSWIQESAGRLQMR